MPTNPQHAPPPPKDSEVVQQEGIHLPIEYTICQCHQRQPKTWEQFKQYPLAQAQTQVATWRPQKTIMQQDCWSPQAPCANNVCRLLHKPETREVVLQGAVQRQIYQVLMDHAPEPSATASHLQLTAPQLNALSWTWISADFSAQQTFGRPKVWSIPVTPPY